MGPFEEEMAASREMEDIRYGLASPTLRDEQQTIEESGKGIIVTTGISTWSERRSPLSSPESEMPPTVTPLKSSASPSPIVS